MGNTAATEANRVIEVAPGFFNVRSSFKTFGGLVDIGTHMSFLKLSSGKFLVIDTVPLPTDLKSQIDDLTQGGSKIEAVIASHPFHTLAFPAFFEAYPNVPYYGTPRHIRRLKNIPWAGDLNDSATRKLWEPEVEMRIPAGAEFISPEPESYNHFNCVWIYYPAGRTLHVDDTVNYFRNPGTIIKLAGKKKGKWNSMIPCVVRDYTPPRRHLSFLRHGWSPSLMTGTLIIFVVPILGIGLVMRKPYFGTPLLPLNRSLIN